ncbi:GDSL-type esterase/lipase family protein [Ruegeria sp.]|uniref:GDSL-type esterase/lipase family protein n=1 Tax=Ruegeria sp. TaxID=1879320 RepID=UPI003C7BBDE5
MTTILPVGDSRVKGDRPHFESYRFELWSLLSDRGVVVDFIGPFEDESTYPERRDVLFDRDHAGATGYSTEDLLASMNSILKRIDPPDVVLLGVGGNDLIETNDAAQKVVSNIHQIIEKFRAANPQVTIVLEQIAPAHSNLMDAHTESRISSLNREISDLASRVSASDSRIIAVDMSTGWSDQFMADDVHYNQQGAEFVAKRYFEALMQLPEVTTPPLCE